ncbi:MAG: porin, partial [Pseudomonadota bacterium]|nr:porin [Pseudomonadota bacterium]
MAQHISKTRIAAAVSAAVLGAGLSAPAGAVVVVGGDDGWEVSFDGNVNAFYTVGDYDAGYVSETADMDSSRVHSGFLPAFFSFNVKSPTVNGLTATGRISFAPTIQTGGAKTQFAAQTNATGNIPGINGATIDTREVLANLSGSMGEISFGRTLSLFGRKAILNDMTLFGVGFVPGGQQFGSVTFGRVGHGYTYPDFTARFQYTTPNMNGLQIALGLYDPSTINGGGIGTNLAAGLAPNLGGLLDETDVPRFEGEMSYATSFAGGSFTVWLDGLWQEIDSTCTGASNVLAGGIPVNCGGITASAWGAGIKAGMRNFEFVGYFHDNEGLGLTAQFNTAAVAVDPNGNLIERKGDGYYVQGTYTFSG